MKTPIPALLFAVVAGLLGAACEVHEATAPQPPSSTGGGPTASVPAPPTGAPAPPPSAVPSASTVPSAPAGFAGEWLSPSCGDRKYARTITFDDRAGFSASDLVSPCPKGVTCIWSGIVIRRGTWSSDGKHLTLAVTGPADTRGAAFPASLDLAPGPTERDPQGAACPYQRTAKPSP